MKKLFSALLLFALPCITIEAQYGFLTGAPAGKRLQVLWRYCSDNFISEKDSLATCRFLEGVVRTADSLHDEELKKYSLYFRRCFRLLFSLNYERYFAKGDFESPAAIFREAQLWASQKGYADIAAAAEHNLGEVYFYAAQYGPAFEHLLKADEAFRNIGYENVRGIAIYLYDLGLNYYRFEEWDKAQRYFFAASHHPFYLPWADLSNLNSIGLTYAKHKDWEKAIAYYRATIDRAASYNDPAWVGIASGNLGTVYLNQGQADSALFYHRKNYFINLTSRAPEDAAFSALSIASVLVQQQQWDSARYYIQSSESLASGHIKDLAGQLGYKRRRLQVLLDLHKATGDYKAALLLTDSFMAVRDSMRGLLDAKIVNRAVAKTEARRYETELKLLESQKDLSRFRFYALTIFVVLGVLLATLLFMRYRARKRRQAQLAEKEKELISVAKLRAEEKLLHAEELLTVYVSTIKEKTALIENLDTELHHLKKSSYDDASLHAIAINMERLLSATILTNEDWLRFRGLFEQVHPGFLDRLLEKFSELSPAEMRLLILTKLNLSSREMASMLGISTEAIRKSRYRLRKKLNLEEGNSLEELIQQV